MIILFVLFVVQLTVSYMSVTASEEQLKKVALQVTILHHFFWT